MKFDLEEFNKSGFVVSVDNTEEGSKFVSYLKNKGFTWYNGAKIKPLEPIYGKKSIDGYDVAYCGHNRGLNYHLDSRYYTGYKVVPYKDLEFEEEKMEKVEIIDTFIKDFKNDEIAINCRTEEEAIEFLTYLDSKGLKWRDGANLTGEPCWKTYDKDTCYILSPKGIEFSPVDYYLQKGYYIIPYARVDLQNDNTQDIITITRDNLKVTAEYKGQVSEARCNPVDDFDFAFGAKLAIDRLNIPIEEPSFKEGRKVYGVFYSHIDGNYYVTNFINTNTYWNLIAEGKCFLNIDDAHAKAFVLNDKLRKIKEENKMQIGDKVRIIAEDCLDGSSGCRDLCNCHNSTAVVEALPLLKFHALYEIRFENGLKCNLIIDEFEKID